MDQIASLVEPAKGFAKDSMRLVKRCTKPDMTEFKKIAFATAVGFAMMGFIGFFVKLIHIPINNILVKDIHILMLLLINMLQRQMNFEGRIVFTSYIYIWVIALGKIHGAT
eukprot:Nk52_evm7s2657 gene=Nk52_evmTU7s2657